METRLPQEGLRRGIALALIAAVFAILPLAGGCHKPVPPLTTNGDRLAAIPSDVRKGTPANDPWPPVMRDPTYSAPVPVPAPISTAGAEDSPYVTWDGSELYFFFANDVRDPAEIQIRNPVNGLWSSSWRDGTWSEPQHVVLAGGQAMDGCQVVHGNLMWFASVRQGNLGEVDVYTAERRGAAWTNWRNAGKQLNQDLDIGEFHLMPDRSALYYDLTREGGFGGRDIWVSTLDGGKWSEPVNLGPSVNGPGDETRPFVTNDGRELYFTGDSAFGLPGPAVFRSIKQPDGQWGKAEEIVSCFAGEPCVDQAGNLYFVHHYFSADLKTMIEADLYIARRK